MKSTSVNPAGNNQGTNGKLNIAPGKPVAVSELIKQAKEANPDAKEPTVYPVQAPEPAPETAKPEASQAAPVPTPEPAPTLAPIPTRSRQDEIEYQVEKAKRIQTTNAHLQALRTKQTELKDFEFNVGKSEEYGYARIVIYDDQNREFITKNAGVAAIVVGILKDTFADKITEKESELLSLSQL